MRIINNTITITKNEQTALRLHLLNFVMWNFKNTHQNEEGNNIKLFFAVQSLAKLNVLGEFSQW